nr:hypothetical protein [uncultured Methanoregula sp.]
MNGTVIIGGHVQGLGIARMLGSKKVPVILMDTMGLNIARFSKYCTKFIKMPFDIFDSEEKFCGFLKEKSDQYNLKNWLLFPTDDQTVAYISKNKKILNESYKIWTPEWNVIENCYNKKNTYSLAKKIGVPIPESYFPENFSDIQFIEDRVQYPLIIKPAVMHTFYAKTRCKAIMVHNRQELIMQYQKVTSIIPASDIIIQEIIPGSPQNLYSFGSFFKRGRIIASIMGRRSRQIPMDFGKASTFVELVNIPKIQDLSFRLLDTLNYYGLSEVEFKYDCRDNTFKLLEINPRLWKWHAIAMLSKLNLPFLLYEDMAGIDNFEDSVVFKSFTGGKWIDEYTDLYISINEIFHRKMTVHHYINSIRGEKIYGSFSFNDPLPFIAETIMIPVLLKR